MEPAADFIIVGGGTSALLLASTLSSRSSKPRILVIEAGPSQSDPSNSLRNPSERFSLAYTNPELDHGHSTIPQRGLNDRVLPCIRGKGLGGSSLVNFMAYLSSCEEDYDSWVDAVGDETWEWENTQKRLKDLENFNGDAPEDLKCVADPSLEDYGHEG